jgi:hypothetical protein
LSSIFFKNNTKSAPAKNAGTHIRAVPPGLRNKFLQLTKINGFDRSPLLLFSRRKLWDVIHSSICVSFHQPLTL